MVCPHLRVRPVIKAFRSRSTAFKACTKAGLSTPRRTCTRRGNCVCTSCEHEALETHQSLLNTGCAPSLHRPLPNEAPRGAHCALFIEHPYPSSAQACKFAGQEVIGRS
jgi:hypothetical protein